MKSRFKLFALCMATLPALAACGNYTNDEYKGYGYDRDNVRGHNEYMSKQDSYMNYQQVDTHCGHAYCKGKHSGEEMVMGHDKHAQPHMKEGMIAPDGNPLMKAKASSEAAAYSEVSKKCAKHDGFRVWKKGEWKGHYVVKYTCFNK